VPTQHQKTIGETWEELACRELCRRGYAILARRYRTRLGEIDIIARDEGVLVFVEVKARSGHHFGGPLAAVTAVKQRKLIRMALDYLAHSRLSGVACRFDGVGVLIRDGRLEVEVVTNAFGAGW